jgi:hypothetical protein
MGQRQGPYLVEVSHLWAPPSASGTFFAPHVGGVCFCSTSFGLALPRYPVPDFTLDTADGGNTGTRDCDGSSDVVLLMEAAGKEECKRPGTSVSRVRPLSAPVPRGVSRELLVGGAATRRDGRDACSLSGTREEGDAVLRSDPLTALGCR